VLDSNPSQIFGKITAPGQVFLSNPNGVVFAPGSRVDVGGLVATTHRIGVADFMAGKTTFDRNGSTGSVVNQGELKAALGGYIALLAPNVRNEGVIIAQAGTVALAAGEAITLNFGENGTLAGLTATQSQIAALVENKNAVLAPGGLIILSAQAMHSLQGGVIKNSGRIEATGISQRGGRIVLDASHTVENTGTISANASAGPNGGPAGTIEIIAAHASNTGAIEVKGTETQAGGSIHIRTGNFTQTAGATLDASAALRGGSITLKASGQLQLGGRVDVSATADSASGGTVGGTGEPAVASTGGQITAEAAQIDLNDATLDASGGQGGRIALDASGAQPVAPATPAPQSPLPVPERGKLILSGTTQLSTRGRRSNGGVGGDQTLLGDHIHLNDTTALDATGATGGGAVRVGGGWQGRGGYYQATTVTMAEGASIDVSATKVGDGGTAVLWSKAYTGFYGLIVAKGGTEGGHGGQVETSSIDNLQAMGNVDALARAGQAGNWLLDPRNVTITTNTVGGTYTAGVFTPTSDSATISASSIKTSLDANTAAPTIILVRFTPRHAPRLER
jgi:large exoprotein involved in heme utilization and adhesion